MALTWTRLRSGLWHGVRGGKVVATVERIDARIVNRYRLTIKCRGIIEWCETARQGRQAADEEFMP